RPPDGGVVEGPTSRSGGADTSPLPPRGRANGTRVHRDQYRNAYRPSGYQLASPHAVTWGRLAKLAAACGPVEQTASIGERRHVGPLLLGQANCRRRRSEALPFPRSNRFRPVTASPDHSRPATLRRVTPRGISAG